MNEPAKTRILIIDDEESIRYAVDAGLEFLGDFDVYFAEDGAQGIDGLREYSPDVVLVDLVLPAVTGMEILEAIRKDPTITRPKRVVLMTGHANPISDSHFEDIGIDRILPKPFKLEQLRSALFE